MRTRILITLLLSSIVVTLGAQIVINPITGGASGGSFGLICTSSTTQILYNNSGSCVGSSNLTYNNVTGLTSALALEINGPFHADVASAQLRVTYDITTATNATPALFGYVYSTINPLTVVNPTSLYAYSYNAGAGNMNTGTAYNIYGDVESYGTGLISQIINYYAFMNTANGGTIGEYTGFYQNDIAGKATCGYAFWYDGIGANAGVTRINDLGIFAYYNPSFADYTPCAADFERIVFQWSSNRAQLGTEAGAGASVKRPVDIIAANFSVKSTLTPAVTDTSANSCGTGTETIAGNDNAGKVTVIGSAGTSCTVTFATAFSNAPSCSVSNETTAALARATSTTTTVILAGVFTQNDVLAYVCIGR